MIWGFSILKRIAITYQQLLRSPHYIIVTGGFMTIIICDDNVDFCNLVEALLKKYVSTDELLFVKFYDGDALLEYCRGNRFDILYLDIEIGKKNGMNIAKELKMINPKSLIIYMSAYEIYYKDMVNAEPFRFISKGLENMGNIEKNLTMTLTAALKRINNKGSFTYIYNKTQYTIELADINFFYSIARTVHINGDIGDAPPYYYGKIDELYRELQETDDNFQRISKSYIVNMNHVTIESRKKISVGGETLSISSKYRDEFFEKYYERKRQIYIKHY